MHQKKPWGHARPAAVADDGTLAKRAVAEGGVVVTAALGKYACVVQWKRHSVQTADSVGSSPTAGTPSRRYSVRSGTDSLCERQKPLTWALKQNVTCDRSRVKLAAGRRAPQRPVSVVDLQTCGGPASS